jgi:glycosyltransferase involved in cell wall biosynthesis
MITGEYPAQVGGVSDYSRIISRGLATVGDTVDVYAPSFGGSASVDEGIIIHRLPGCFGPRALAILSGLLKYRTGKRLLVQYVPHAFGLKAMNLPFCLWLYAHARRHGGATVIFHEVYFGSRKGDPIRHRMLNVATKIMAALVAKSASQIFITTSRWESYLRRYVTDDTPISLLPVPSTIAVVNDAMRVAASRRRLAPYGGPVVGHFGTYPPEISRALGVIIATVLSLNPMVTVILIGANSDVFRQDFLNGNPSLKYRVVATGVLGNDEVSVAISSCDVIVQPYSEGVSSRRTSMMAALQHARAVVTTAGPFTEPFWDESAAVLLAQAGDFEGISSAISMLLHDPILRSHYENRAKELYVEKFDLTHTIKALRA